MKFILLGSGAVRCDLEHWGPSQIVEVAGERLLFDCGRGATMRMQEAGIPWPAIRRMFFTHYHFDHTCDFAYFFLAGWVLRRDFPLEVTGPRGTKAFCDGLFKTVYADDIRTRRGHPTYTEHGCDYVARDVTEPEWTLEGDGWRLRAVHTIHKAPILDNLAYRIDSEGKSIVVAGDNIVCESLMKLAEGCDLLVHECSFPSQRILDAKWDTFHTPPRELGRWAKERGVKRLLLKHFCIQQGVAVEPMAAEVRETFGDEGLIVGRDLLEIEV